MGVDNRYQSPAEAAQLRVASTATKPSSPIQQKNPSESCSIIMKDTSKQLAVLGHEVDNDPLFLAEFMAFYTTFLGLGGTLPSCIPNHSEITGQEHQEVVISQSPVRRYELVEPNSLVREKLDCTRNINSNDTWSCDSSINSGSGVFSTDENKVQVVVDPRLRPPSSSSWSPSRYRRHKDASVQHAGLYFISEDDTSVATLASEGSATSAQALPTTAKLPDFLNGQPYSSWSVMMAPSNNTATESGEQQGLCNPHPDDQYSHLLPPPYRRASVCSDGRDPTTQNRCSISISGDGGMNNRSCQTEGSNVNVQNKDSSHRPPHQLGNRILGTSVDDETTKPHVLTMPIMDSLQEYLPPNKRGEGFWLKYSMVRDGANLRTVLDKTKRSSYTVLAVETLDGEVFGAFTAKPWHITWKYYGTPESFLWRLKRNRKGNQSGDTTQECEHGIEVEVFRFASNNTNIQLCNVDRIAVGGGCPDDESHVSDELSYVKMTEWGFGLSFGNDLQHGTSSPCMTFNSPSLSKKHADGSRFEVSNVEFWTLTPCLSLEDAQRMEMTIEMV